jgi:hypothetical protein
MACAGCGETRMVEKDHGVSRVEAEQVDVANEVGVNVVHLRTECTSP